MKRIYRIVFIILSLSLLATSALAYPPTPEDPWDGLIETDIAVSYTEADAKRYLAYFADADMSYAPYVMSIEGQYEAYLASDYVDEYFIPGLPLDSDLSQEEIVCIAYAWLEQQGYVRKEVMSRPHHVSLRFMTNAHDSTRLWLFNFNPLDDEGDYFGQTVFVYIASETGHVVYTGGWFRSLG